MASVGAAGAEAVTTHSWVAPVPIWSTTPGAAVSPVTSSSRIWSSPAASAFVGLVAGVPADAKVTGVTGAAAGCAERSGAVRPRRAPAAVRRYSTRWPSSTSTHSPGASPVGSSITRKASLGRLRLAITPVKPPGASPKIRSSAYAASSGRTRTRKSRLPPFVKKPSTAWGSSQLAPVKTRRSRNPPN
jgi:hypothetical protein